MVDGPERRTRLSRGAMASAATAVVLGWAGAVFVLSWLLVRHPGPSLRHLADQPVSPALWQVGLALGLAGITSLGVALLLPRVPDDAPRWELSARWWLIAAVVGLVVTAVPIAITVGVASESRLRYTPIVTVPFLLLCGLLGLGRRWWLGRR